MHKLLYSFAIAVFLPSALAQAGAENWKNLRLEKNCYLMEKPDKKSKKISNPALSKGATPPVTELNQDWYKMMAPVEGYLLKSCFKK